MNKTSVNILCVLIIVLLAFKFFFPFLDIGTSISTNTNHELTETHTPFIIGLSANKLVPFTPTDTLTFESGEKFPVITREINLFVPDNDISQSVRLISVISYMIIWVLALFALYEIIRFIVNINRSKIFVRDNVKRLRLFGWSLLAISALMILAGLSESSLVKSLDLNYSGRTVKPIWEFPWTTLLVGFSSLLIAQVWSNGIHLREDNELTI